MSMFFLWIRCGNRGKGYYLPQMKNWSGRLALERKLTGENAVIELPVTATDGVCGVEAPEGFSWADGSRPQRLEHCTRITLVKAALRLDIFAAELTKQSTAMRKFAMGQQPITVGSKPDNSIQYEQQPVSRQHAVFIRRLDGACQFKEQSSNGSYVNGEFCCGETRTLHFGDSVVILPSLHICYLGECLAVSNADEMVFSPQLKAYSAPKETRMPEDAPVAQEYHRAPRHLQHAQEDVVEIDPPLEKERPKELPTWLAVGPSFTMVLPMLVSAVIGQRSLGSSLAMIGTSSALAVMWSTVNRNYQRKQRAQNEENRQKICRQYYAEIEERLGAETERERKRLLYNYLSVGECAELPGTGTHRLWERLSTHSDFLQMRLGLGEMPLPTQIKFKPTKMALIDDPLRHEPQQIYDRYSRMNDVPVVCGLTDYPVIGILGQKNMPWLMQSMVIQTAANHSYYDVRMAILHDEEDAQQWNFAKWIPHVFATDDRSLRMVVSGESAVQEVMNHIDGVLSMRAELKAERSSDELLQGSKMHGLIPWYLIFCTDPKVLESHSIARYLNMPGLGFTLIIQTPSMSLLPKECECVIEAKDRLGAVYNMDGSMTGVRFESVNREILERFARNIAPMRIRESVENTAIPSLVTFLETYHVRQVEELDIRYYWSENHAHQSIKACLGYKAGGVPFFLDISDKNHGPHGLIAGTTGAGKSVLLQTFILSLAINYSPTEVQFILIDYKGGGTSEDFRTLPHAAGIIDSLQGERMIFRALASVKGEILRREEIFKNVGVNNIDDYMKLFNNDPAEEPLGHLIIIVDEFAELKKEQPEFMHELVSAARVGRSLGMHLVLATQKPSNSVSDEIAANTRFRICLRVASKSDSSEMLKRPEAAFLKGMGRCYVQVGNDELFEQVQTSYSGAAYSPEALRPEEEPRMLNEAGQPIRFKRKKNAGAAAQNEKTRTEMDAVLEQINRTCTQYHFDRARSMWLEELKEVLYLHELAEAADGEFDGSQWFHAQEEEKLAYFAMADDIEKQRYLPIAMDFVNEKNQLICGLPGSGKTTLLQTVAVSLAKRYTPDEVQLYVFSLTSRMLNCLRDLPHVGDIVFGEELDEQIRLMERIYAECERRKRCFAQRLTDNYIQYNRAVRTADDGEKPVPVIVVMIDRMQQLREWADNRLDDKLQMFYDMLRSASSLGVYFVMTAFSRSELPAKYQSFVHAISLQMNERMDYADALGVRVPSDWGGIREYPGRGMIAKVNKEAKRTYLYEIQTAVFATNESDAERAERVSLLGRQMHKAWTGALPAGIDRIPKEPVLGDLLSLPQIQEKGGQVDQLPLFYDKNSGQARCIPLRRCFSMLICGPRESGKTNLLMNIASTFAPKVAQVHVIGGQDLVKWARRQDMIGYEYGDAAWEAAFNGIYREMGQRSALLKQANERGGTEARSKLLEAFTPIVILIDDMEKFIAANEGKRETQILNTNLKHFCEANVSGYGVYVYMTLAHSAYGSMRIKEPINSMIRAKRGIMLQGKLSDCDPFDAPIPYNKKSQMYPLGEGLFINENEMTHVVIPKWSE